MTTKFTPRHAATWAAWLPVLMLGWGSAQAQTPAPTPLPTTAPAAASPANAPGERAATVKKVAGAVQARSPQGNRPLRSGDELQVAERVLTGADGSVSLVLRDGTTLMVGPNSELDLREFAFNSTTHNGQVVLSMLKGTLRVITGLIGKHRPDAMRVITPTSTIGVLGTDFIVEVGEEQP